MRVSIWRQFSSNHSSHFTVVGEFPTEAEAREALERFREIFQAIFDWFAFHDDPFWTTAQPPNSSKLPSPPELDFARRYNVDWDDEGIDWLSNDLNNNLLQIGRNAFISVDFETWQQPTLIKDLMAKFGGIVKTQISEKTYLSVHLTCNFPNEAHAQTLVQQAEPYFISAMGKREPWKRKEEYESLGAQGRIKCDGQKIIIDCQFFEIETGLPVMIEWLQKAGATDITYTLTEEKEWSGFNFDVRCETPNSVIASEIYCALLSASPVKPWLVFDGGKLAEDPKAVIDDAYRAFDYESQYLHDTQHIKSLFERALSENDETKRQAILQEKEKFEAQNPVVIPISRTALSTSHFRASEMRLNATKENVYWEGNIIDLRAIPFNTFGANVLPALVAWMRTLGCTVTYEIKYV